MSFDPTDPPVPALPTPPVDLTDKLLRWLAAMDLGSRIAIASSLAVQARLRQHDKEALYVANDVDLLVSKGAHDRIMKRVSEMNLDGFSVFSQREMTIGGTSLVLRDTSITDEPKSKIKLDLFLRTDAATKLYQRAHHDAQFIIDVFHEIPVVQALHLVLIAFWAGRPKDLPAIYWLLQQHPFPYDTLKREAVSLLGPHGAYALERDYMIPIYTRLGGRVPILEGATHG